jgi:ribose transport system substrate-binding protein
MRPTPRLVLSGSLALAVSVLAVVAANASSSRSNEAAAAAAPSDAASLAAKANCNSLKKKTTGAQIAYMPPGLEFPYYIGIGQGVKQYAKKYRYKVFTSSPVSGADYAGQASRMRDVIHRGVDGIIFHTHNNSATAPLVKQAVAAGIAVVIVNQDLTAFPAPIHAVVGYRERKTDRKMGKYAVKLMKGNAKIGLIEGLPGYDSTERIGGFRDGIKGASGMDVVASQPGGWDVPGGNKTALDMLQAHPDINLIFAANDFMAEGAYQAAKTLHKDDIAILGSDGDTNAFELINQGGQYKATMNTVPVMQGRVAMQVMHACLSHTFKGFYKETPGTLVTKANVRKVLCKWDLLWPKPKKRYTC